MESVSTKVRLFMVAVLLLVPLMLLGSMQLAAPQPALAQVQPTATPMAMPPANGAAQQQLPQAGVIAAYQGTLEQIYNMANDSVVNINTYGGHPIGLGEMPQDMPGLVPQALGSGFVWDDQGYIVTNNHVVEGAQTVEVAFSDGTTIPAQVVGTSSDVDLAVLKVDLPANQLQPVTLADSNNLHVGQLAIAIGNPFGLQGTMTVGIISALGRSLPVGAGPQGFTIPDIIQTDAPINPGNSGGPLFNADGQVVGVTSAIESPVRANAGIGFAVPTSIVRRAVPALINNGEFQISWLGIQGAALSSLSAQAMNLPQGTHGVMIVGLAQGGPAEQAGLQAQQDTTTINNRQVLIGGDVITAIDGQPINNMNDLITYITSETQPGDTVTLTVLRNGQQQQIDVTLQARPVSQQQGSGRAEIPPAPLGNRAQLGIRGMTLDQQAIDQLGLPGGTQGVLIGDVVANTPAAEAGLQAGDVITGFNNQAITSFSDLRDRIQQAGPGANVTLTVLRNGQQQPVDVTLSGNQQTPQQQQAPQLPATGQAQLGISGQTLSVAMIEQLGLPTGTAGVLVNDVMPNSPAANAGLQSGDVITHFNGEFVTSIGQLQVFIRQAGPGANATLTVLRNGQRQQLNATLGNAQSGQPLTPTQAPGASGAHLGIRGMTLTSDLNQQHGLPLGFSGVVITSVQPDSPASDAGLQAGDVISGFDGQAVSSFEDLRSMIQQAGPGADVSLMVVRNGQTSQVGVTLGGGTSANNSQSTP